MRRTIDTELDELFPHVAAIAIDGPKGVGKSTTAEQRAREQVRLDTRAVQQVIAADPERILDRPRPLLIDEWQRVPAVWDVVRRAVDSNPTGGQFLLAGSATPRSDAPAHSGAGRIGRLRMRPMTLVERGSAIPTVSLAGLLQGGSPNLAGNSSADLADYVEEVVSSGLPAIRPLTPRARRFQIESYIRNAVDRDLEELGVTVRKPDTLLAWLRSYAAATATTARYSQILDAATPGQDDKPARSTAIAYRDALASMWLLDPVPAWTPTHSPFTRLGANPKHHLADPALAAHLLGLTPERLLDGVGRPVAGTGSMLGNLFESLVTLCVRVSAQAAEATVGHLRTKNGDHEIDLVVVREDDSVVAIEVKLANTVDDTDTRHLHWLRQHLGSRLLDAIIVNTGPAAYRRPDGIGVVPLSLLGP
ncbi:hypothetical protein FB461_1654 [Rarobacter faecitabidus]|uniref:AAA+ ATPase domain-containing protein n=2 Tax=Rarobacter faecitabidus TaxID=13243 RepID=A0A542ZNV1_RARFA|nr:hypothetical protein FB461_1654 [Rarobacter faecitabidus]